MNSIAKLVIAGIVIALIATGAVFAVTGSHSVDVGTLGIVKTWGKADSTPRDPDMCFCFLGKN